MIISKFFVDCMLQLSDLESFVVQRKKDLQIINSEAAMFSLQKPIELNRQRRVAGVGLAALAVVQLFAVELVSGPIDS